MAGLRFPFHAFFAETLSHFHLAPSQLTPNDWRVLVGIVVLCHSDGVPPSLAVFRIFFSLHISPLEEARHHAGVHRATRWRSARVWARQSCLVRRRG